MQLPENVVEEIERRLRTCEPPRFGKVRVELELNYADGRMNLFHLAAYAVETVKA